MESQHCSKYSLEPFLLPTSDGGCLLLVNVEDNGDPGDILIAKISSSGEVEWNG